MNTLGNRYTQKRKNEKGFTLIELIVVLAILGILMLILVPSFMGYAEDAKIQVARANAKNADTIINLSLAKFQGIDGASRLYITEGKVNDTEDPEGTGLPNYVVDELNEKTTLMGNKDFEMALYVQNEEENSKKICIYYYKFGKYYVYPLKEFKVSNTRTGDVNAEGC